MKERALLVLCLLAACGPADQAPIRSSRAPQPVARATRAECPRTRTTDDVAQAVVDRINANDVQGFMALRSEEYNRFSPLEETTKLVAALREKGRLGKPANTGQKDESTSITYYRVPAERGA